MSASFNEKLRWVVSRTLARGALLLVFATSQASAQGVGGGLSTQRNAPTAQLAQTLAQLHLVACAPVIQRAADFLFDQGPGEFTVQPLGPDPNRWPTVVTIESTGPDTGQTRFSTFIVAPSGSCSGFYQQTIYWPQPCAILKKTTFAEFRGERPLYKSVQTSEANVGLQLYLMPAGTGCVSIKKELLH